jgi:N-acetylmuramoyl-L-alanine amidase
VPDNEAVYHCGSSRPDPVSGRVYTGWARAKFGPYAERPDINSPNNCTIGIELCVIDGDGNFTPATLTAARELAAKLLKDNRLTLEEAGTHNMMVGWKDCPRLWTKRPELFEEFKEGVRGLIV